ncbi:hypothetical protein AKO1_007695 [Acrasis kona]|uniref:Zn(2)-C6 fungal-type domain-containing protein n=1 Tax=Acrasis kona TaxID=1008807 RepID=A0AAW2YQF5_9EUKA
MSKPSQQGFSQYSCQPCRVSHKKCDRVLPSCGWCEKRGKECQWEATPRYLLGLRNEIKQKEKKEKKKKNAYINHNSFILSELVQMKEVCNILMNIMPLLPTSTVASLYQQIIEDHGGDVADASKGEVAAPEKPPSDAERAYINLFISYCCMGSPENKRATGNFFYYEALKVLNLMGLNILEEDEPIADYLGACCFVHLCSYYIHSGDVSSASICLQKVWRYIEVVNRTGLDLDHQNRSRHNFLTHRCFWNAAIINNSVDCQMLVKLFLRLSFLDFAYFYPHLPFDESYASFIERLGSDIRSGQHSEVLSLETLSKCMQFFRNNERNFLSALLEYASHGYRIDLLRQHTTELTPEIIESADSVVNFDLDKYTNSPVWQPLLSSTRVHLELYNLAKTDKQREELLPILSKERTFLTAMQKAYNILEHSFTSILSHLNHIIEGNEDEFVDTLQEFTSVLDNPAQEGISESDDLGLELQDELGLSPLDEIDFQTTAAEATDINKYLDALFM